ncbi:uncharacterized protein BP5553_08751 [Venustampulla echinocandica]|uniref:Protein-S-isoprenylcysteine O-methyltransferase n=1 Tax=Venustampulla echinocandica TaxID=2656787 RepID=A0A370TF44_9HELO|nr:uncharacterized protein BP5553_08751 [Venustampulla echinocandica]RDL33312.1 hypothetical protein BP5553_08751 [Venustampulla echinocandica]
MVTVSLSNGSFIICLALTFFINYLCHVPPTPTPEATPTKPYWKDRIEVLNVVSWNTWITTLLALVWTYHLSLILFPTLHSTVCRHPELLNEDLFTWSTHSTLYIIAVFIFGMMRLAAYAKLGENFTFGLTVPSGLITTGLYHYIQHPSYVALFVVRAADFLFVERLDGVAACVLPERIVRVNGLSGGFAGVSMVLFAYGISLRVRDEEEMLSKEFGKEWKIWHKRTKRFIPGLW